jgi:hypothetical protein
MLKLIINTMKDLSMFVIETPMFSVRVNSKSPILQVSELTFTNLRLQTALKVIDPFWFLNLEQEWEQCRPDGVLKTYPYSEGFVPQDSVMFPSALGIGDYLEIQLFNTLRKN